MNHTEAEQEAQEHLDLLTGMLQQVRHKGLVRWNPQTLEEALDKFKMLDDIDAVLAPGQRSSVSHEIRIATNHLRDALDNGLERWEPANSDERDMRTSLIGNVYELIGVAPTHDETEETVQYLDDEMPPIPHLGGGF